MKAEHRKELETNILADKVGKLITGAKEGPSRGFVFYLTAGLAAVVVAFLLYRWWVVGGDANARLWLAIEDGDRDRIAAVYKLGPTDFPGKVAAFQFAWEDLWFFGLKRLGENPKEARKAIAEAEERYVTLAKACQGDPVFQPEALYGLAVIAETNAIDDRNNLVDALDKYKAVVKANKESAFAVLAQQRVNDLEDDEKNRAIQRFYHDLEIHLRRQEVPFLPPGFEKGFPGIPKKGG
jgi:hypothetical protein